MDMAIQTHDLTRLFAPNVGIRELNLQVPTRAIFGFLGPNGAGKTTTIRLLLGLLRAQRGRIEICGQALSLHSRAQMASLIESPSLYAHLSAHDNLDVTRCLLGAPKSRIHEVLQRVGLASVAKQKVREFSLGMRQRLGLALTLLAKPRVLILDEPGNGLDPNGVADLRVLLQDLVASDGLTVFLSSHLLSEVESLATHVGVLHQGRAVFQGTLSDLKSRFAPSLLLSCSQPEAAMKRLQNLGEAVTSMDESLVIDRPKLAVSALNRILVEDGIDVSQLQLRTPTLEQMFFELTQAQSKA